jgi:hypothetical protein
MYLHCFIGFIGNSDFILSYKITCYIKIGFSKYLSVSHDLRKRVLIRILIMEKLDVRL